jgi:hypothetical protein
MNKRTAIGHMSGKIAKLLYMMLKTGQKYAPQIQAKATSIPYDSGFDKRAKNTSTEQFHQEALELPGDSTSDDIEIIETLLFCKCIKRQKTVIFITKKGVILD